MPELPEVETMRRTVAPSVGGVVKSIGPVRCRKRPLKMNASWRMIRKAVAGKRLERIDRIGKRLLFLFSPDRVLMVEPRMSGLILATGEPNSESLRFEIRLRGAPGRRIAFWDQRGLGKVFLFDRQSMSDFLSKCRVGPDALEISTVELRDNLASRKMAIKPALLDQKAVAGVGNIYASELLNAAGIHPARRCCDLSGREWKRIHRGMLDVLNSAIEHEGSTLRDGTFRKSLDSPGSYQSLHCVYDQGGKKCPRCRRGIIQRIVQAQRSTWFCDECQK
jgi:formamidopyrimidine-DNA glycosylase